MQEINAEICFEFKKYRRLIIWWYKRKKKVWNARIKVFIGFIFTIGTFIAYWYMGSRDVLLENTAGVLLILTLAFLIIVETYSILIGIPYKPAKVYWKVLRWKKDMGTYIKSISFFPDCMNIEYSLLNIPFQETILYNQPVDIKVSPFGIIIEMEGEHNLIFLPKELFSNTEQYTNCKKYIEQNFDC